MKREGDVNCGNTNFEWRYDRRSGNCNLTIAIKPDKITGLHGIWTHELCFSAAVLYHLSYEDPSLRAGQFVEFI